MSASTGIEWTDATWNPVTGCTKVSPGCDHCYAETLAERFRGTPGHHYEHGFDVQLRPGKLDQPLRWKKSRRVFVNSMSDLFHQHVPDEYIARVWAVMANSPHHTFQILTKRHARMRALLSSDRFRELFDIEWCAIPDWAPRLPDPDRVALHHLNDGPLPNVWLGVSVENQQWADVRIPALLDTPAAVRFLSCEPLLGPVRIKLGIRCHVCQTSHRFSGEPCDPRTPARFRTPNRSRGGSIDWVIVGGESGHGARPMHPDWARSLRDQCTAAGVPFLFKQWGEWGPAPWGVARIPGEPDAGYKARAEAVCATAVITNPMPDGSWALYEPDYKPWSAESGGLPREYAHGAIRRWGKKAAGRELDGRTWDEFPEAVASHV